MKKNDDIKEQKNKVEEEYIKSKILQNIKENRKKNEL